MKVRHAIAKFVAPKLYADMVDVERLISGVPRPMTTYLKTHLNARGLVGVEIGTAAGNNALSMLRELPIKKLFLVDPYVPYIEHGRRLSYVGAERIAKDRLGRFSEAIFVKKSSDDALADVTEPLDFVYIDGNHDYDCVKRDITNYYPLVKPGGVLGGHDYLPRPVLEVCDAVDDFVQQHRHVEFHNILPDWWIIK